MPNAKAPLIDRLVYRIAIRLNWCYGRDDCAFGPNQHIGNGTRRWYEAEDLIHQLRAALSLYRDNVNVFTPEQRDRIEHDPLLNELRALLEKSLPLPRTYEAFESLRQLWTALADQIGHRVSVLRYPELAQGTGAADALMDELVTLSQAAALVHRGKRTLERWKSELPAPDVPGGNGQADRWYWQKLRPALMEKAGLMLPDRFPGSRII